MKKSLLYLSMFVALALAAMACNDDDKRQTVRRPGQASISGGGAGEQTCEDSIPTYILTAEAANATSFVWRNGDVVIAGETSATLILRKTNDMPDEVDITVAGVNSTGTGVYSIVRRVMFSSCQTDSSDTTKPKFSLIGTWNVTGIQLNSIFPEKLKNVDVSWLDTIIANPDTAYPNSYIVMNHGGGGVADQYYFYADSNGDFFFPNMMQVYENEEGMPVLQLLMGQLPSGSWQYLTTSTEKIVGIPLIMSQDGNSFTISDVKGSNVTYTNIGITLFTFNAEKTKALSGWETQTIGQMKFTRK